MIRIIEHTVDLEFPVGVGVHALIAQIPCTLGREGRLFKLKDRARQEHRIFSVLETVASMPEEERLNFVFFPESSVPFDTLDRVIATVSEDLPDNIVTVLGVEHITLGQFRELLKRFGEDNSDYLQAVMKETGDEDRAKPVNLCVTIVKEKNGTVRCFFSAKTVQWASCPRRKGRQTYFYKKWSNEQTDLSTYFSILQSFAYREITHYISLLFYT
jgi:hypothetical protein